MVRPLPEVSMLSSKQSQRPATPRARNKANPITGNLEEESHRFAREIVRNPKQAEELSEQLIDACREVRGKDFLIVHDPGGWGHARMETCLEWEKGIVNGVAAAIGQMGYSYLVTQYFRSGFGWRDVFEDSREQLSFFSHKAEKMAAWLRFIVAHVENVNVILVGVSQGAAFGNAVMQRLDEGAPVYSIELGFPFVYRSRRKITKRTLAIDDNGEQPDKLVVGSLWDGMGIFAAAPFKWIGHHLRGEKVSLPHCVNTPGHAYDWGNPFIENRIRGFLKRNFTVR